MAYERIDVNNFLWFEPGDATRYLLFYRPLTNSESVRMHHGGEPSVFWSFGAGAGPWYSHTFNATKGEPLSYGYYVEKMYPKGKEPTGCDVWTACVGLLALCALTGREPLHVPIDVEANFKDGWKANLIANIY